MAFPGGNIIEEAVESIVDAVNLAAAHPPGGIAVAVSIRVTDARGNVLNCCPDGCVFDGLSCVLGTPAPPSPPPAPPPPPPPPAPSPGPGGGGFPGGAGSAAHLP